MLTKEVVYEYVNSLEKDFEAIIEKIKKMNSLLEQCCILDDDITDEDIKYINDKADYIGELIQTIYNGFFE